MSKFIAQVEFEAGDFDQARELLRASGMTAFRVRPAPPSIRTRITARGNFVYNGDPGTSARMPREEEKK